MTKAKKSSHLVQCLSDLHFGKNTPHGFDLIEAEYRFGQLPEKLFASVAEKPDHVWLLFGGDLHEGTGVFQSQDAVASPVMDSKQVFQSITVKVVRAILRKWRNSMVHIRSVPGNHGFHSRSGNPISNHDTESVLNVADLLVGTARLDVKICRNVVDVIPIGGRRVILQHRAERHASTNALVRRVERRFKGHKADLLLAGHWHTSHTFRDEDTGVPIYIQTGNLCGRDEYTDQLGYFPEPRSPNFWIRGDEIGRVDWINW